MTAPMLTILSICVMIVAAEFGERVAVPRYQKAWAQLSCAASNEDVLEEARWTVQRDRWETILVSSAITAVAAALVAAVAAAFSIHNLLSSQGIL